MDGTGNVLDLRFTRFEEGVRVRSSVVKSISNRVGVYK